jgi:DNA polymerase-3 subunit beta
MSTTLDAVVLQEGSYTVPARLLQEVVSQVRTGEVSLQVIGGELHVTNETVQVALPGIDAAEYPSLPELHPKASLVLQAASVVQALKRVVVAVAQDQGRPILTGVLCTISHTEAVFAATDSFRLSEYTITLNADHGEHQFILPARAVQELVRVASQILCDEITITLGEGQMIATMGTLEITSRLLSGAFPKYQAIIPKVFVREVTVSLDGLIQALRLVNVFSNQGVSTVRLELPADGEVMTVTSHKSQRGSGKQQLPLITQSGSSELLTALNTRFILDALGVVSGDVVTLQCSGTTSPLVITSDDPQHLQLVMPIRLDS